MAKKSSAERFQARKERGSARREKKQNRAKKRTANLAARKGISNDQAKDLQANRSQRWKEFASGGTENITTGRLRFGEGGGGESTNASLNPTETAPEAGGGVGTTSITPDRAGTNDAPQTGRGGKTYTPSVEIGEVSMGGDFSDETLKESGYKPKGGGAY